MIDLKEIEGDEDAEREWVVGKLQKVENAILAANVIMLLITGRGTDQQVASSFGWLMVDLFRGDSEINRRSTQDFLGYFVPLDFIWPIRKQRLRYIFGRNDMQ